MQETGKINWNEWGSDAFSRAEKEGKLLFLDISATWCHWCHVLDRTSLSDPRVVRILGNEFIPVRVDTDRRPDINDRYNQGGWPTIAVLLPNGQLLTGATYLPPDVLLDVLQRCTEVFRGDRGGIERYVEERAAQPAQLGEWPSGGGSAGPHSDDLPLVKHTVLAHYDPRHPGFFREPKFLVPDILGFLRDAWALQGDSEMRDVLGRILEVMGSSAVFDSVEGGFFRYATRRDWSEPHYEKLLADNAEMLSLYAYACERTADESHARVAEGIIRFLFDRLRDPGTGAFYSSQDADEEYYRQDAEGRSRRPHPPVDMTVISEYNGRAVSALVSAHRASGSVRAPRSPEGTTLLSLAGNLGKFLRERYWDPEEGQVRFSENGAVEAGHLADNESVAEAYLDLWEAGADPRHLAWAGEIIDASVRLFFSPELSGFMDRRSREGDAGALHIPLVPFSLNARMACVLMRYCRVAGRTDLLAVAERTLNGLSSEFGGRSAFGAPYGSALLMHGNIIMEGGACRQGDPFCQPGRGASPDDQS